MVYVFITTLNSGYSQSLLKDYLSYFPKSYIKKAYSFKNREDTNRFFLGKILLLHGMRKLGYTHLSLKELSYNSYERPFFKASFDFNISHSGNYILCALSKHCKVGIDIEEIKKIHAPDFLNLFTENEQTYITNSHSSLSAFFQIWTRKEAIVKADGRGLTLQLADFDVRKDQVSVKANTWYLKDLAIAPGYCSCIATNTKIREVQYVWLA